MSYPIEELEPLVIWKYFSKICKIPHGSRNEKNLGEAVMQWAKKQGCDADKDTKGNVVVRVPATKGHEAAPIIVLQGHMDMVCEKNSDTQFDFEKDSIVLKREGDWITADGTTLGADNGIGMAAALAFMETDSVHGPLELLFTVEEEIGLFGAVALQPDFIKGRMLFNLDSEEDGVFYVGCAGGKDTNMSLPVQTVETPGGFSGFKVEIRGLRGGHSGMDIIQNRGNAIRLLARAIEAAKTEIDLALVSLEGGDKHNAIPREAVATLAVKAEDEEKMRAIMASKLEGFLDEFASAEPELSLSVNSMDSPAKVLDRDSADGVLRLVLGLPHGVQAMVRDMPSMVETSTNLARVRTEEVSFTVLKSTRSSIGSALDGVIAQVNAVGLALGAEVVTNEGYPGWAPNMNSTMLRRAKETWADTYGSDARFEVIHAGLECGIIGEKYQGMDMISLGPTIQNPHSPEERLSIPTVERFFGFIQAFLTKLAH